MSKPEFDHQALQELREDLDDDFDAFVVSFLTVLDEGVVSVRQAAAVGDYAAVSETAHGLKGTAGYLGASALVAALGALQRDAGDAPQPAHIAELIDTVASLAARLRDHVACEGSR